jgi:hypothetical protein
MCTEGAGGRPAQPPEPPNPHMTALHRGDRKRACAPGRDTAAPRRPLRLAVAATALALLASSAIEAQYRTATQYRSAGDGLEIERDQITEVQRAMSEARMRLGPFRAAPVLFLRDVSYQRPAAITDEGERISDWTAAGGAGLKLYLPVGPSTILAAHAIPEYTWWRRLEERNRQIGRYGVGLFFDLNRLRLEATGRRVEDIDLIAADRLVRQPLRTDLLEGKAQLRLAGSIAVAASARLHEHRFLEFDELEEDGPAALLLDRDHRQLRGGLRYLLRADRGWLGFGVQQEETEFLHATNRDHEGSSLFTELRLRGTRLDIDLDWVQRELEPTPGSEFAGFEANTGRVLLNLRTGWRLEWQLMGRRELRFSALDRDTFFEEERYGLGLRSRVRRNGTLQLFYELGENRFFGDAAFERTEDVTAWGASLGFPMSLPLFSDARARMGYRQTRFESDLPGFDREIRELTMTLSLAIGGTGVW